MLIVAIAVGILMISVIPFVVQTSLERVLIDYLHGSILGIGVLIFTVSSYFNQHLLVDEATAMEAVAETASEIA